MESDKGKYQADRCKCISKALMEKSISVNSLARNGYPGGVLPKNALQSLCTIGSWDIPKNQNWGLSWHRNEGIEITYLANGSLNFSTEVESKMLKNGDLTITQPWQSHCLGNPNMTANKLFWIILDLKVLKPNDKWQWPAWICLDSSDLLVLEKALTSTKNNIFGSNKQIEFCFKDIDKFIKSYNSKDDTLSFLALKINELFYHTISIIKNKSMDNEKKISPSLYSVEIFLNDLKRNPEKLCNRYSVEEMARLCGVNQTTFFNFCKKISSKTPSNYINFLRIEYAKKLMLSDESMSITDIAMACGFDTSQYFSTVFASFEKKSPRQFKIENQINSL